MIIVSKKYYRSLILIASIVIQLCLGGVYAWSVFVAPLKSEYDLSTTQAQIIFGSAIAAFTISMVLAGRFQDKLGAKLITLISGLLFGCGYILASISGGNFLLILIGIGIVAGCGIGFGYVCALSACVKWFPEYKGLVTGLAVAGFGGGAILLSYLASTLIERGNSVSDTFRIIGLAYGIVLIVCAIIMRFPKLPAEQRSDNTNLKQVLRQKELWALALGMFCGTFSGLMVVGNIKPIGLSVGLKSDQANLAIAMLALGNAGGRIAWGIIYDKVGKIAIPLSLIALCYAVTLILPMAYSKLTFALAAMLTGFGFGACFVVYAAQIAANYGTQAVGHIYPVVFLFYGMSGILGPYIGGMLFDTTGSYTPAMATAALTAALGAIATVLLSRLGPKDSSTKNSFVNFKKN